MSNSYRVARYGLTDPITKRPSGDYLQVGDRDLGGFRDIVEAEYQRAKREHPGNPAFHMRPMFYTGSPYGREILELVAKVRA